MSDNPERISRRLRIVILSPPFTEGTMLLTRVSSVSRC